MSLFFFRPRLPSKKQRARWFGRWAERLTMGLFWLKGWDVVAHNLRMGRWELDLILCRGPELRLLEVKARGVGSRISADVALTLEQRRRLQGALRSFLDTVPWPGDITFQRVCWSGWRVQLQLIERWESLRIPRSMPPA